MKPKFHARIRIRFLILYTILGQYGLKRWYGTGNCLKIIGSVPDAAVVRSVVQDIQRIFSVQFCDITSRYPCSWKWCVWYHFLPHSKKIKVYQNWFTLKYCHQVTTDVVKLPTRTENSSSPNGEKLNKIQSNGQNQGTPILVEAIEINRLYQNW